MIWKPVTRCRPVTTQRRHHPDDPDSPWISPAMKSPSPPRSTIHELIRQSCKSKLIHTTAPRRQPIPCMMFSSQGSQSSYDREFFAFPKSPAPTRPFVLQKKVTLSGEIAHFTT